MRIISSHPVAANGGSTRKRSGDLRPEAPGPSTNGSAPPGRRGQLRVEQGAKLEVDGVLQERPRTKFGQSRSAA